MPDREKVIKGLEHHIGTSEEENPCCFNCPYEDEGNEDDDVGVCGRRLCIDALALLKEQPEIVRCKDCVYWQDNNDGYPNIDCRWREDETPDSDDFCSFGERKERR